MIIKLFEIWKLLQNCPETAQIFEIFSKFQFFEMKFFRFFFFKILLDFFSDFWSFLTVIFDFSAIECQLAATQMQMQSEVAWNYFSAVEKKANTDAKITRIEMN